MERQRIAPIPETPQYNSEGLRSVVNRIGSFIVRPLTLVQDLAHELSIGLGNRDISPDDVRKFD